MPNFFEDVGRSGAAESLMQVPKLAVELSKLNTEASNQRFKAAIDLKQLGMQEEELAMKKVTQTAQLEQTAQQTRKAKFEADELQKKAEYLDRWSDPNLNPVIARLPDESRKLLLDGWKASGAMNEKGKVQTRTMLDSYHELSVDPSKFEVVLAGPLIKQAEAQVSAAHDEYVKELAKGPKANQEKLAELSAAHKIAYKNYMEKTGQIGKASEQIMLQEKFDQNMKLLKERIEGAVRVAKEKGKFTTALRDDLTKAMKGASAATSAIYRLKTTGGLSPELAAMMPQVAEMMKSGNKDEAIASLEALKRRYEDQIKALGGAAYYAAKPGAEDDITAEIQGYE